MNYFRVNYNKLENLTQTNYHLIIIVIISLTFVLLIISFIINISHTISFVGIYDEGTLQLKINYKLSDAVRNCNSLSFNGIQTGYEINSFLDYEIYDDNVFQNIELKVDKSFINNEVGIIKIHYNKEKLINYIFKLFN